MALVDLGEYEVIEELSDVSAVPALPAIGELDQLLDVAPVALGLVRLRPAVEVRPVVLRQNLIPLSGRRPMLSRPAKERLRDIAAKIIA